MSDIIVNVPLDDGVTVNISGDNIVVNIVNDPPVVVNLCDENGTVATDYSALTGKPKINNIELVGNKSLSELGIEPKRGADDFYVSNAEKNGGLATGNATLATVKEVAEASVAAEHESGTRDAMLASTARTRYANLNLTRVLKSIAISSSTMPIAKPNGVLRRFYIYGIVIQPRSSIMNFGIKYEDDNGIFQNVGNYQGLELSTVTDLSLQSDLTNVNISVGFKFKFDLTMDVTTIYPYATDATRVSVNPTQAEGELNPRIINEYMAKASLATIRGDTIFELAKKSELLNRGLNYYNKSLQTPGANGAANGYLDNSGIVVAHATAKTSYYIPIVAGDWYVQGMYGFTTKAVTYGADMSIKRILYKDSSTAPANAAITFADNEFYIRFSIRDINTFMLERGNVMHTYEPYLQPTIKPELLAGVNKYQPLKVVCFGDSITDGKTDPVSGKYATWTEQLAALMGVNYARHRDSTVLTNVGIINMGSSGMRIAYQAGTVETTDLALIHENTPANNVLYNWIRRWETINTISYAPTLFIIAAGTNDVSQASDKGTFTDAFSTNAFADDYATLVHTKMTAELKRCVLYLQKGYPNAQIIYCTPIHGTYGGRDFTSLSNVSALNTQVVNRMQAIVCDNFNNSGINGIFENNPFRDTIDGVHPNLKGAIKFAKNVLCTINSYYKF